MTLADASGLEMLSMRKLAQVLGVTPMSLYNQGSNKEELLDLMLDRIVASFQLPQPEAGWQEGMRKRAISMREGLLAHPWAMGQLTSRISLSEAILRDMDATAGCLLMNGFSHQQADWTKNTIDSFVYGFVLQEINFPVDEGNYQEAASHYLPMIDAEAFPHMHSGAVAVASGTYDGVIPFTFGLELIISGIAAAFGSN